MKVIVIGSTLAGTYAVQQIMNSYPDTEVTIYEKNDNLAFVNSGISMFLAGDVNKLTDLFEVEPKALTDLGVNIKLKTPILKIDADNKKVFARDLATGETLEDTYDKLIVTTGSFPILPPIKGIDSEKVMLARSWYDAKKLADASKDGNTVAIVGAGYIGVEIAEAYSRIGHQVILFQASGQVLRKYHDVEYSDEIVKDLEHNNVKVVLEETVIEFEDVGDKVIVKTNKGVYSANHAIVSVGSSPSSQLLNGIVDLGRSGEVIVDEYMRTSHPDILAAGDVASSFDNPAQREVYIPLGSTAVRQGTILGMNIIENRMKYIGTQASSGLQLYGVTTVTTGLTKVNAIKNGIDAEKVVMRTVYPLTTEEGTTDEDVLITLTYRKDNKRLIGGQMRSRADVSQTVNTLSVAIQNNMTLDDLAYVDQLLESSDRPFNILNFAAQFALNNETNSKGK